MSNLHAPARISGVIDPSMKDAIRSFIKDPSNEFASESDLLRQLLDFWHKNGKVVPSLEDIKKITKYPELASQLDKLNKDLSILNNASSKKDAKIEELTKSNSDQTTLIGTLETQVSQYKANVTRIESELRNEQNSHSQLTKTYNELEKKYEALFKEYSELEKARSEDKKVLESRDGELAKYLETVDDLEKRIGKQSNDISEYQSKISKNNRNVFIIVVIALISVMTTLLYKGGYEYLSQFI